MKYFPKNTETVDAIAWLYHKPGEVKEFMKFVEEHGIEVSLCSGSDGGVAVEIHRDGVYLFDVEPYEYLVVDLDGKTLKLDEDSFNEQYVAVA